MANWDVQTKVAVNNGTYVFETVQDVEPYLDYNQALRDAYQPHAKDRPFRMAFSIPIVAYKKALTELGIPHARMYKLTDEERHRLGVLLKHPDYAYLRTIPGKL